MKEFLKIIRSFLACMPKTCFVNEAGKCQLAPLSSCAVPSLTVVYLWVKEGCFSTLMQWFPVGRPLHLHFISKMSNGGSQAPDSMRMKLRSHFSYSHCSSWRHAWNRGLWTEARWDNIPESPLRKREEAYLLCKFRSCQWWESRTYYDVCMVIDAALL